ncbi:MAG: DUF2911 domain-containing protein [Cyclobacteriaceae bacterium]
MNCIADTCMYYNSIKGFPSEKIYKHPTSTMNFVGGWVPLISLIEWKCLLLAKSNKRSLPLKMINHNIGVYPIGVHYLNKDTVIFGGPFLEYTKFMVDAEGRIKSTDGIGTPWNYYVTKHDPIDVDQVAKRMAKTKGIGIPSPTEKIELVVKNMEIKLSYGRPFKRGRKIFGGVVPYDSVWRTGANSPTIIFLSNSIKIGKSIIPKGTCSLYTIPRQNEWTLIFNQDIKTWPTDPDRREDFTQVIIPVKKTDNIKEQFTIEIVETKKGGVLKFQWDDVLAVADFQVMKN